MNLMKNCRVKPMYNEIELHPLFQQKDTVEFCEKNDIQIISYSPFARIDKRLFENTNLINISERENTSIANIILKWNINKGYIPVSYTHLDLIWTSSTSLEVRSSENTAEALTPKGSETTNAKEILETV